METYILAYPFLAFILLLVAMGLVFKTWNRFLRHLNILAHGWPPAHLDADGDFHHPDDE